MTVSTKSIERKRADAFVRIAQNTLGTSLAAAVPTPALELTKTIGIAAADAWMFYDVYKIYYDERLSAQRLNELLGNAGVIIMTGGAISYGALKVSQGLISEFLNAIPFVGWIASGVMSGTSTVMLGLGWMAFVEAQYRLSVEADSSPARSAPRNPEEAKKRVTIVTTAEEIVEEALQTTKETAQDIVDDVKHVIKVIDELNITPDEDGKILALHPEGKREVRVDAEKYLQIRSAMVQALHDAGGESALDALTSAVEALVGATFDGSVKWYVTTLKLDLEARGIIERVPDEVPQRIRFK